MITPTERRREYPRLIRDFHLTQWPPGQTPTRQTAFTDVADLAKAGKVTAPGGGAWDPTGFIVNGPLIAQL